MNPLTHIPDKVRIILYVLYALLGPVLIYCASRGWTGEAEYALYVGVGTALGLTAASNIESSDNPDPDPDDPALGERILLDEDEVTRGVSRVQGEVFDPNNRPNFGN